MTKRIVARLSLCSLGRPPGVDPLRAPNGADPRILAAAGANDMTNQTDARPMWGRSLRFLRTHGRPIDCKGPRQEARGRAMAEPVSMSGAILVSTTATSPQAVNRYVKRSRSSL